MSELFDRRLTLTVSAGGISRAWSFGEPGSMECSFAVQRTAGSEPNQAEVSVWNLAPDSRRMVSDDSATVRLSAGYAGTEGLTFSGDVDEVLTTRDGADVLTRIRCSDGGRALRSTVVNVSTSRDTPKQDLVDEVLNTLGLPRGSVTRLTGALKQGFAGLVPAKKLLDELTSSEGARWSVQDGESQVHPPTGTPEPIVLLSAGTGMVGIPERLVERDQQGGITRSGVRVRSLLQPGIRPGRRIRVQSSWLSGDFVCERVNHSGDTVGGEWYTDAEAY